MGFVQPNTIAQTSGQNPSALIEIIGRRGDQALKIDRRTYRVGDNAHAEQSDTFQLLRGLPAVTITPDQHIMLLGNPQVRILVDERPVEGDALQYLRTLHGSDIERIEIITNPSAQYSAEGTGGIINIVLRKKRSDGLLCGLVQQLHRDAGRAALALRDAGECREPRQPVRRHGANRAGAPPA